MGKIIGITGEAGSGKDTVANYLKDYYPRFFRSVAFADPLRSMLVASGAVTLEQLTDRELKEQVIEGIGKSPRQMAQTLGTEWARQNVNEDFWLLLAKRRIDVLLAGDFNVLVTDVRFENEAAFVRKLGGVIWHIKRKAAGTNHKHASEAGIKFAKGDVLIDNNETMGHLFETVDKLVKPLVFVGA